MSVQSTSHIWQYNDLDANTTSICYVDKKQICDVNFFNLKIKDIEVETKCTINLHGIENQNGIVWIRIKNQLIDSRRFAILLINSYTNNSCKEIVLPKLDKINSKQLENGLKKKKSLTRSSTEHSISSINSSVSASTPFSSILSPFAEETSTLVYSNESSLLTKTTDYNRTQIKEQQVQKQKEEVEVEKKSCNKKEITRKRYNLDFLLARSTVDESKKLPKNWKELNLMYPNICFVGTVLSYFNASKYYDHWIKLQNENTELHNPIRTISNFQYLNLNQDNNTNSNNNNNKNNLLTVNNRNKNMIDFMNREYLSLNNSFDENKPSSSSFKINLKTKNSSLRPQQQQQQQQQTKQDFKLNNKIATKNQAKQFCATQS